jgi:hypothetical protein
MVRSSSPKAWFAFPALVAIAVGAACAGSHRGPAAPPDAPGPAELLVREAPTASGALVFPPPPDADARRPRKALPPDLAGRETTEPLRVVEPSLDGEDAFTFAGQRLRITFNQPVARPEAAKLRAEAARAKTKAARAKLEARASAAGDVVKLTPSVAYEARWADDRTLEVTAAKPFDPDATYAVELAAGLASVAGKKLEAPWKAHFQATPAVMVAGKVVEYIPRPGHERPVAVHPSVDRVGSWPELSAVYDQPIDLALARSRIALRTSDGTPIPFVVAHPATGRYQGVDLDPRLVVLVRPARRLAPDEHVELEARSRVAEDGGPATGAYTVVRELAPVALRCDYGYRADGERCEVTGSIEASDGAGRAVVHTSEREVHVLFDNGLATGRTALASRVRVTPRPKNLGVRNESWDEGRLVIEAAFAPSTHYDVEIGGLEDRYGGKLARPVRFAIETAPLAASAAMAEGLVLLDEARTKRFAITTRNVEQAEIAAWPVPTDDPAKLSEALEKARARELPEGDAPIRIPVAVKATRDRDVVTAVDLSKALAAGGTFVATLRATRTAFGAEPQRFPRGSEASKPPVAVLGPGDARSLAVHARTVGASTIVHVARFANGEPVAGASVKLAGDDRPAVTTDASGVALLPTDVGATSAAVIEVRSGDVRALLPAADPGLAARDLFPDLAAGDGAADPARRAMVLTDRGIYRPGSTIEVKASLRRPDGPKLLAIEGAKARLRLVGPTGDDVASEEVTTSDTGGVAARFSLPPDAKLGRHQVRLEDPQAPDPPLARALVQVAEFEAPRFAVDVVATEVAPRKLRATVKARYLFGAPMSGATVRYTLNRAGSGAMGGPLGARGLAFAKKHDGWLDEAAPTFTRTGEATLGPDGSATIEQAVELDPRGGPQDVTFEADVTDASFRHVAGRASVRMQPAKRYAGVRVASPWAAVGAPLPIELGVVDEDGKPITGVPVTARVRRLEYRYVERRAAGGARKSEWVVTRTEAGRCAATSAMEPATCAVRLGRSGDFEIEAEVGGQPGGTATVWAWRDGEDDAAPRPHRGHVAEVVADKARYAPGDTAKILVRSPFAAATAILTLEQGGLVRHESRRIDGPSAMLDAKLSAEHAPWVHAAVTLLPIGAKDAAATDFRVGAVRLPVSFEGSAASVAITTDKRAYEPGEEATITVDVKAGGAPARGAEVALAVVDEGVLRLTGFHAPDPSAALRPGRALDFRVRDSRQAYADAIERSHVAGDGGGAELTSIAHTRKKFVETAYFKPDLRVDEKGRATVKVRLPDNLSEWRVSAVAIDPEGRGGVTEASFTVRKPLMLVPAVPRFALVGDAFEAATMVHNEMDHGVDALVRLGERSTTVSVQPHGKARVAFPVDVRAPGEMALRFDVSDRGGPVLDRVEARVRVEEPGVDERPSLDGSFVHAQEIRLDVPASARPDPGGGVVVLVGQHLWPELGERLDYLLGYPHGCVEQTTSSTLPLIAARDLLPRIGFARLSDGELVNRIRAGLERLATMKTAQGGLAYWPGGDEPNVYGTAYAIRAVALAKRGGIEPPKGLLEGMTRYLGEKVAQRTLEPEVAAAIAQSLAELDALPPSAPDALWDRRSDLGVFGLGSLAIALGRTPGQEDRVADLLDRIEAGFDEHGALARLPKSNEFYYYGSPLRTRSQAAIALGALRRGSALLPKLVTGIARETGHYTTQATAWSLIALAEHLRSTAKEGANVRATLDGAPIAVAKDLGGGGKELRIPLEAVRGKKGTLRLEADGDAAIGFLVRASWRRPLAEAGSLAATTAKVGPDVHRVFTDPKGAPVDLAHVKAGDVLRVALVAELPVGALDRERLGYVALTDRLPAGFEPIQPDLATVASAPDLTDAHPLASLLRGGGEGANHVELHDDRVDVYFDRTWRDEVAATYLVRATTPGRFTLPPARAELMYEADSAGFSEAGEVRVQ